jgi:hypothetical protein
MSNIEIKEILGMDHLKKPIMYLGVILLFLGVLLRLSSTNALAFSVSPLPEDNLIENPWFRSSSNPTLAGLDGWTNVLQNGVGWGVSQKEQNPTPDIVVSGRCGFERIYCGTAARWAQNTDKGVKDIYPGLDVYLYQVVSTNSSHRKLNFFTYWVSHRIDVLEVTIYGGSSPDGPWEKVWLPVHISVDISPRPTQSGGKNELWTNTGILSTTITKGYKYYKVEIHARYPEPKTDAGSRDVGVKITGLYFATEFTDEAAGPLPSTYSPTSIPTSLIPENTSRSRSRPSPEPTRNVLPEPTQVLTFTPQPSPTATERLRASPTSLSTDPPIVPQEGDNQSGFQNITILISGIVIGMIIVGLIFLIISITKMGGK